AALPLWGWAGRRTRRHRRGRPHAGDLRLPWGDLLQPRELRNRLPLPRATRPEARTNYFLAQPRLRAGTRERRLLPHPGRQPHRLRAEAPHGRRRRRNPGGLLRRRGPGTRMAHRSAATALGELFEFLA